jgi:hypothetical protein
MLEPMPGSAGERLVLATRRAALFYCSIGYDESAP